MNFILAKLRIKNEKLKIRPAAFLPNPAPGRNGAPKASGTPQAYPETQKTRCRGNAFQKRTENSELETTEKEA
ncbi:hypothetical protein [uncultured Alistipes sp.]|uniref:hypothetical protein n=1 Tax=uncultured Alistipes sp. TaxID=538949 RepID=UPI0023C02469|nr:hypothetical protein [uncultured Alistipes sp.]MDE7005629.1 hypothetical protein [Alistipes sp.]